MTKKSLNKLLSVILTLAICFTTVFGCLITANAAVEECCAKWSEGTANNDLDKATIYLAFNAVDSVATEGFSAIEFALDAQEELELQTVKAVATADGFASTALKDGSSVDVDDIYVEVSSNKKAVIVESQSAKAYSTIVLEFTYGFVGGTATQGATYNISANDIVLAGAFATHECDTVVSGSIKASCNHVVAVKGSPINIDTNNKYAVYADSYCTLCGEDNLGYQLVPSTEPMNGITIYWDGTDDSKLVDEEDGEQTGKTADSPIIINSAEELHYLATAAGRDATYNNYYKLADGITTIVLQPSDISDDDDFNAIKTAGDVKTYFSTGTHKDWSENTSLNVDKAFAGHFDGNGVTIEGLYSSKTSTDTPIGLFPVVHTGEINATMDATIANNYTPYTSQDPAKAALTSAEKFVRNSEYDRVTISGVNITKSYAYGGYRMGFVVGFGVSDLKYKEDYWVDIKNCSVYNSYMESRHTGFSTVNMNGLLAGYGAGGSVKRYYQKDANTVSNETAWLAHCGMTYDNCLVYGNETVATNSNKVAYEYGIGAMGNTSMGNANIFTNTIILGTIPYLSTATANGTPEQSYSSHRSVPDRYSNVYTDVSVAAKYTNAYYDYSTGLADTNLNDANAATVNNSYVGRIKQIATSDALGYDAVTACPNLDWDNTWSYGADGEYPSLVSGESSNTIYWNGNTEQMPLTEEGSDKNPYIVQNAEQLAWLVSEATPDQTFGKYFKIKDGIQNIVLQADGAAQIMALSDVASVKDYLSKKTVWKKNNGTGTLFCGHFDGNGAAIYGMRADNGALFSYIGLGATIKNLAVYNSYCYMNGGSYSAILVGCVKSFTLSDGTKVANTSEKKNEQTDNVDYNKDGKIENKVVWVASAHENGYFAIENVEIANCKLTLHNTWWYHQETVGILVGSNTGTFAPPHISGLFVHGNDMEYTGCFAESDTYPKHNVLFGYMENDDPATNPFEGVGVEIPHIRNSLILDSYIVTNINGNNELSKAAGYSAVYTNMSESDKSFVPTQYKNSTYYPGGDTGNVKHTIVSTDVVSVGGGLAVIDSGDNNANIFGSAAKTTCLNLDWGTVWYANPNGYPTLAALEKARVATESNGSMGLIGSNVAYNNDGSLDFNFHFIPVEGYEPVLYVGKADKSGYTEFLTCTDPVPSSARAELGEDAMMFTIPNLSSRDINTVWVPTLVATNGAVTEWGKSQSIALADYANSVLNEEVVYGDDVTEEIKIADKRVAAALLNYADAATNALYAENDVPTQKTKTIYWDAWGAQDENSIEALNDTKASGDSWESPIIIDNTNELYWLCRVSTSDVTTNKYFKIADDIKNIILLKESHVADAEAFMAMTDVDEIAEYVGAIDWNWAGDNGSFNGNFDGNGATIYGMRANGLFGYIDCGVHNDDTYYDYTTSSGTTRYYYDNVGTVIKNINIKNSYYNSSLSGGIVYRTRDITAGEKVAGVVNIENCSVTNSYFTGSPGGSTTAAGNRANNIGAFIGFMAGHDVYKIDNCIAHGNKVSITTTNSLSVEKIVVCGSGSDRFGVNEDKTANTSVRLYNQVTNSILLDGVVPYNLAWSNNSAHVNCFSNVYTDQPVVVNWKADNTYYPENYSYASVMTQIDDKESIMGATAMTTCALDWESGWMINNNAYPTPVQSGYTASAGGKTIYWDGKNTTDTVLDDEIHDGTTQDGTEANPIIIDSAEELAYLASAGPTVSQFYNAEGTTYNTIFTGPKHFRIADGIDKIVLQNSSYSAILELSSLEETRKYFAGETGVTGFTTWAGVVGWDGATANPVTDKDSFCGVFDGNGVEIYGIYMNGTGYGGLFGDMDGNSAVKNVTVKNSYIHVSTAGGDHRAAAIVSHCDKAIATGNTRDTEFAIETIKIENCKVENCHIGTPDLNERSGGATNCALLAANLTESKLSVNNCIVSNSEAYYDNDDTNVKAGLIGAVYNNSADNYSLKNSIILGVSAGSNRFTTPANYNTCFNNVYTDQTTAYSTVTVVDDLNTLKGSKATNIVNNLNNANGKTVWYVGAIGDYPGFSEADALPSAYKAEYDALVLDKLNVSPKGGTENFGFYSTSINLRANPYMSFIFNFGEAYKTNRNDITVTFTYTVGGNEITKTVNVPAYEEGKDLKADGWSNLATSKKHTYQFTDLPVQALVNGVNVAITYGDESVDCGTYSAKGTANAFVNANKKAPCSYYEICAEATKALVYYTQALTARYGN